MALKPTIYKAKIELADIERNQYDTLGLTLAQHPSENLERMMARVLAYCMNADMPVAFTKGLSTVEEPDIWAHTMDDRISLWIDMGEPAYDRIKKACRLSEKVKIYTFNFKSDNWWAKEKDRVAGLDVSVVQFQWAGVKALAGLVKRTMDLSVTISGGVVYISTRQGDCEVPWKKLQ